jgi:hypothetical protein
MDLINGRAVMASMAEGSLYINPILMARDPKGKRKVTDTDKKPKVMSNFMPDNGSYLKAVLWHEFGHQIARYFVLKSSYGPEIPELVEERRRRRVEHLTEETGILNRTNVLDDLFSSMGRSNLPSFFPPSRGSREEWEESEELDDRVDRGPNLLKAMAPSEYGSSDPNECFAESFALHKMGMDDKIHPRFKQLFERLQI